jgi:hypothetical protein
MLVHQQQLLQQRLAHHIQQQHQRHQQQLGDLGRVLIQAQPLQQLRDSVASQHQHHK